MGYNHKGEPEEKLHHVYHTFTAVEKAVIRIISKKVWIWENGKAVPFKFDRNMKAVYMFLLDHYNPKYELSWPSHEEIGEACDIGKNTVVKAIKDLERAGLIEKKKGDKNKNYYVINEIKDSKIIFDRKDEHGNYVHDEIDDYIKAVHGLIVPGIQRAKQKKSVAASDYLKDRQERQAIDYTPDSFNTFREYIEN